MALLAFRFGSEKGGGGEEGERKELRCCHTDALQSHVSLARILSV
jgi:hypothetical protein